MWELWDFSKFLHFSVQIFTQAAKSEEDFLYLSKITKNELCKLFCTFYDVLWAKNTIILKKNLIFLAYMRKKQYLCRRKGLKHDHIKGFEKHTNIN